MRKFKPLPPLERVEQLLHYEPETGQLFWKQSVTRWIKPGDVAGTRTRHAVDVTIDTVTYRAHRVIWLLVTKADPGTMLVDHIDGNPHNNRRQNLRLATARQNQCNQKIRSDNTSGAKGVSWCKNRQKWQAGIYINGKRKALGRFDTKEEAFSAYKQAALLFHGAFARLN